MNKKLILLLAIVFLIGLLVAINYRLSILASDFEESCKEVYTNESDCFCSRPVEINTGSSFNFSKLNSSI